MRRRCSPGARRLPRVHAEGALPAGARRLVRPGTRHAARNTATTVNRSTVLAIIVPFDVGQRHVDEVEYPARADAVPPKSSR